MAQKLESDGLIDKGSSEISFNTTSGIKTLHRLFSCSCCFTLSYIDQKDQHGLWYESLNYQMMITYPGSVNFCSIKEVTQLRACAGMLEKYSFF
jgi:hypothetical protein